jgi:hypothetical protein
VTARQHDWRPLTQSIGVTTLAKVEADGTITIRSIGADAPTLDHNATLRALATTDRGYSQTGDMKRVATIPAALIVKWRMEEGLDIHDPDHAERFMRKLNDPDYAYLRTAPGRLGMVDGDTFR